MSDQTISAAPEKRGFFNGLVTGPGNLPDEAAFIFLVDSAVIIASASINTFTHYHFPLAEFAGASCALIPLYTAALSVRGMIGKGQ